jgi:hypothetical protein
VPPLPALVSAANPKPPFVPAVLATVYGMMGRLDEARMELAKAQLAIPGLNSNRSDHQIMLHAKRR